MRCARNIGIQKNAAAAAAAAATARESILKMKMKLLIHAMRSLWIGPRRLNSVISPTHKRTEGRAPVWGSEFTTKASAMQGGFSRNRSYAERKVLGFGDCVVTRGAIPGIWNSQSTKLKAGVERAVPNLESRPKESSWGPAKFCRLPLAAALSGGRWAPWPRWAAEGQ
jgi:hypothetical protein